jgi:hypothetical protein
MHASISHKSLCDESEKVSEMLSEQCKLVRKQYNDDVKQNREIFKMLLKVICLLCKQECALRGHDESTESLNPGNFKAVSLLVINENADLKEHWGKMGHFNGLSKTVQNELLELIEEDIKIFITDKITEAPFYSCMVDESTDITETSQCSIIIRLVDRAGEINEFFHGFFDVSDSKTSASIFNVVSKALEKYNMPHKLIAQTYDGASVMAGELNGLRAKVNELAPQALFTHCFAHRLNLW